MSVTDKSIREAPTSLGRVFLVGLGIGASAGLSLMLIGVAISGYSTIDMPKWVLARSAGLTAYVLLALVVALGLLLSHPHRSMWRWPVFITRLRIHVGLAVFALVFTALHIIVLINDDFAHVGLLGAFLPMASEYRPLPVTLGIIGLWAGTAAGVTAARAGHRLSRKIWWVLHKIAAASFVLVWFHSLLAGSDPTALMPVYVVSGAGLIGLALWRYTSRTPIEALEHTDKKSARS
jgi:DMSO/TMAO reductase YedYZ heme-binding membrane subunit